MKSIRFSHSFKDLLPPAEIMERTMGYKPGEAPETVMIVVNEVIADLMNLEEARSEYLIFDNISFDSSAKSLIINDETFHIRPIIYSQMKKSESAALFICTAGQTIGIRSSWYMKNEDLLRGYIYDVVGSEIVESVADRMQEELRKLTGLQGKNITNRFSPGYCGWNVSEQRSLFSFFPENYCGITLTESALMKPVKSVSGVIGIGKDVKFAPYQCKVCSEKQCIYRNRKR